MQRTLYMPQMTQTISALQKRWNALAKQFRNSILLLLGFLLFGQRAGAQGTWVPIAGLAPDYNAGVMILLTDGRVMVKTSSGGNDWIGNTWDILTPDIHGSYVNGTWTQAAPMADTRLYYSSQVLKDGHVYVAGGEYGTGRAATEIYYPESDTWVPGPVPVDVLDTFSDANSEILPDGKVLQAIVNYSGWGGNHHIYIYDPATNTYTSGADCLGSNNESAWVKLPDSSILYVDIGSTNSERYIPATNTWVADASLPVGLYDPYGFETGAAFMLPDGRAFFIGSASYTAFYTPSGNTSPGTWSAGPAIPGNYGAPDAAAAMMVNGVVLCAFSHTPSADSVFWSPMKYFVFDYTTNAFVPITAPDGTDSVIAPCYYSNMLCLPDGSILYGQQGDDRYYVYKPDGDPLPMGKPVIDSIIAVNCDTFMAIGKMFNGITEGACYGDDWQMATNYPLVRLSRNDTVYYAKTTNWNSTGIMRGSSPDTTTFVLPAGMPLGTYALRVVANGNPSDTFALTMCGTPGPVDTDTVVTPVVVQNVKSANKNISVYPNPAKKLTTIAFDCKTAGEYNIKLVDVAGRIVKEANGTAVRGRNTYSLRLENIPKGIYTVQVREADGLDKTKLVIE